MRIAILSDIHANLPALEVVLDHIHEQKPDAIWHLGDFIGYGAFPEAVVRQIKKEKVKTIVGNYDLNVLSFPEFKNKWKGKKDPSKYFSFEWTYDHISEITKKYLKSLPQELRLKMDNKTFLLVHGSPEGIDDPLTIDTPLKRFEALAKKSQADCILCGHTHVFFVKEVAGVTFINPGSVGRPFDKDARASYALMELSAGKMKVKNFRLAYDIGKSLRAMQHNGFPEDIMLSIALGKSLDDVNKQEENQSVKIIDQVIKFANGYNYEREHSHQVTKLALNLFDELKPLHNFGDTERLLLQAGGLLHDIGWIQGRVGHHKASRDFIINGSQLPFTDHDRIMIGLIARYHRRALPRNDHKYFDHLSVEQKAVVCKLGGLLRLADGLDRRHASNVEALKAEISAKTVLLQLQAPNFTEWEKEVSLKKSDLFEEAFRRKVVIEVNRSNAK